MEKGNFPSYLIRTRVSLSKRPLFSFLLSENVKQRVKQKETSSSSDLNTNEIYDMEATKERGKNLILKAYNSEIYNGNVNYHNLKRDHFKSQSYVRNRNVSSFFPSLTNANVRICEKKIASLQIYVKWHFLLPLIVLIMLSTLKVDIVSTLKSLMYQ